MENYQGDLTDIVRGSRTTTTTTIKEDPFSFSSSSSSSQLLHQQQQQRQQQQQAACSRDIQGGEEFNNFGDPFCAAIKDPLFQELDSICGSNNNSSSSFFNNQLQLQTQPCNNLFSRMLQISSPTHSPSSHQYINSPNLLNIIPNSSPSSNPLIHHFVDNNNNNNNNNPSTLQISSPRNTPPGIKRRKSQARKVVCVPAPVSAGSSRPNGEVIPSDLWAWRKYGQKPIKGSPYPRGYYRCSSSKGCSARKQVERSRTDPNMLVITYTSEHNHPWPTQRNALAGSSRSSSSSSSQHSKNNNKNKQHPNTTSNNNINNNNNVKEEALDHQQKELIDNKQLQVEDQQYTSSLSMGLSSHNNNNNNQSDDFFADLEELHTNPLNLLFTHVQKLDQCKGSAGLDEDVVAFDKLFDDWEPENNRNHNNSNNPIEEPSPSTATKRGFY